MNMSLVSRRYDQYRQEATRDHESEELNHDIWTVSSKGRQKKQIVYKWSVKMESGELTVEAEWTMKRLSVIVWIWRTSYEGHDTKKIQKKYRVMNE